MPGSLRSWLTIAAISMFVVGLSEAAFADNRTTSIKKKEAKSLKKNSDCAKARKRGKPCKIIFKEGDTLEGGVATGSGESVVGRGIVTHSSLIRLRTSFRDLIIRTAEQL